MSTLPDVRPGQVWADNDPRATGRTLRVERLLEDDKGPYAVCIVLTSRDAAEVNDWGQDTCGRRYSIRLRRFRPTSTGYRLIKDAPNG